MSRTAAGPVLWRWCLAAGLLAFLCSWLFGRIPGLIACGETGGLGPIIAFEFARTPGDVAALFGAEPCRSTLIGAQRTGLWLDALGFIPSYTAFLSLAALATGNRRRWWIVVAVVIAGLSDEIEGGLLFAILRDLPGTPAMLATLFWPVHVKFVLLGVGTFSVGAALVGRGTTVAVALGGIVAAAGLWSLNSLRFDPSAMMAGFTVAWTTVLLVATIGAFWPRLLARPLRAPAVPSA